MNNIHISIVIGKALGFFLYMCFEHWLGRTQKIQAGSVLELAINGIRYILSRNKKSP